MQAREKVQQALQKYLQRLEEDDRVELDKYKRDLNSVYNSLKEEELNIKLSKIEVARRNNNHRVSWQLIIELCGRRITRKGQLKGKTQQERIGNWYNHFQTLLGKPPDIVNEDEEIPTILNNLGITECAFIQEKYQRAKKAIMECKACGEDGVSPEVLKRCQVDDIILEFCNTALLHHKKPSQWSLANIIPIPKSGDLSLGGNYRGISLSSLLQKTYNKMILHRIRSKVDLWLRIYQKGFRPGRTTVSQILALRRIIEGVKENNLSCIITFIDFKKAFDSIHRGKMLCILKAYGILESLVNATEDIYSDTKAKVLSPDGETKYFSITAGVLQGDTLAPYLFIIVMDYALRKALNGKEEELGFQLKRRQSSRVSPEVITDLDFADDIALLS